MRHSHGSDNHHHAHRGRGGEHHHGGGRRQRFFGHGELRLVILDPTLDFLEDQQFITLKEEENGRKKIEITLAGQQWLDENLEHLEHIQERVKARCVGFQLRKNPQMKRALDNFKAVLDLKVNQGETSDAQIKQIIGVIDRAALEISQMD